MTTPTNPPLDPSQVQIGTNNGPGIYLAPEGTDGPTTLTDPWAEPWMPLGYLSADGPTVGSSTTTTDITPWQSVVPIRTLITARTVTLAFVMWQLNPLTLSVYFDADPTDWDTSSDTVDMSVRSDTPQHVYAVGIDSKDDQRIFRLHFTRANLSSVADMTINRGAAIPLSVTLTALDDNGQLAHLLIGSANGTLRASRTFKGKKGAQELAGAVGGA